MSNLSEETAVATLRVIEHYLPSDYDTLGITEEEFALFHGPLTWRRDYFPRVIRTANALIFGSLEQMALPKIVVPAEYVAAVVAVCVHPANQMACCIIMAQERATGVAALELAARGSSPTSIDPTSGDQLFALVAILNSKDQTNFARKTLRKKLGLRIDEALKGAPK